MKVRRRIYDRGKGTTKVKTETVTLLKTNKNRVLVRLGNGDIIKRKIKDVIKWDVKK